MTGEQRPRFYRQERDKRISCRRGLAAVTALATLALAAPVAQADILATLDQVRPGSHDLDLAKINATTGAGVALPTAVNTLADEVHPSFSRDSKRIVFLRADVDAGTRRVVMMDLTTGQSADLFSVFEASTDPPGAPVFSEDGTKVLTGRKLEASGPSSVQLQPSFTQTDVTNFPSGPFPHQVVAAGGPGSSTKGRTLQPYVGGGGLFAFGIQYEGERSQIVVRTSSATTTIGDPTAFLSHPAISRSAGVVVYEREGSNGVRQLLFRPIDAPASASSTPFPGVVDAPGSK